jgi:hypothetical protein
MLTSGPAALGAELSEKLRQAAEEQKLSLTYDEEGNPETASAPFDVLISIMESQLRESTAALVDAYVSLLKRSSDPEEVRLASSPREHIFRLLFRNPTPQADRKWAETISNPEWQRRWDELFASIYQLPPTLTPEELDAEIEAGREASYNYQERRARRP